MKFDLKPELREDNGYCIDVDISVKRITIVLDGVTIMHSCYMLDSLYIMLSAICEYDVVVDILEYIIGECNYLQEYHDKLSGYIPDTKIVEVKKVKEVVTQLSLF